MFQEEQRQHALGLVEEGYSMDDTADIIECSTRSLRRWMMAMENNEKVWQDPRLRNDHEDAALRNADLTRASSRLLRPSRQPFSVTTWRFSWHSAWTGRRATTGM